MCNRLPEIKKNGDAGIFPVYYSLNTGLKKTKTTQNTNRELIEKKRDCVFLYKVLLAKLEKKVINLR